MTGSITLVDVLDDAALLSLEHQIHLAELLGEHGWSVDLAQERFTFTGDHPVVCTAVHLLGTAAPGPRSWLWSWANPAGYGAGVVGLAESVREFGQAHGLAELATPDVPFHALPGDDDPHTASAIMVEAAKAVTGRWTAYTGDAGGGTRAAFLLEHPDFLLPPPAPERVLRVVQQALAELTIHDHRRAVHSYAVRRGLDPVFTPDVTEATLAGPGFTVTVGFDGLGRVARLSAAQR
jgi:hypothetical protein